MNPYPSSSGKKLSLDTALAKMVARDFQPMSMVEDLGFRAFVKALDKRYILPSRKTLTQKLLPQLLSEVEATLLAQLEESPYAAITSDAWTSRTQVPFLAVTVHFWTTDTHGLRLRASVLDCCRISESSTAAYIQSELMRIMAKFKIIDKITAVVTDRGSNMVKAVKDMGVVHVPCFAHTLNLVVTQSLSSIEAAAVLKSKVSALVRQYKKSSIVKNEIEQCQAQLQMAVKTLLQACPTRWNSEYEMYRRVLELKDALGLFFSRGQYAYALTHQDWDELQDVVGILRPFYQATVEISGEKFVTFSKSIPLCKSIGRVLANMAEDLENRLPREECLSKQLVAILREKMAGRFGSLENEKVLALATLLDPRFKTAAFTATDRAERAMQWAREELSAQLPRRSRTAMSVQQNVSDCLWGGFDNEVQQRNGTDTVASDVGHEQLGRYIAARNIDRNTSAIEWWNVEGKGSFPDLFQLAQKYLVIPATSVPSERVFSAAGGIITERRTRLTDENARMLVFLQNNLEF
jgi:hypothetical protein